MLRHSTCLLLLVAVLVRGHPVSFATPYAVLKRDSIDIDVDVDHQGTTFVSTVTQMATQTVLVTRDDRVITSTCVTEELVVETLVSTATAYEVETTQITVLEGETKTLTTRTTSYSLVRQTVGVTTTLQLESTATITNLHTATTTIDGIVSLVTTTVLQTMTGAPTTKQDGTTKVPTIVQSSSMTDWATPTTTAAGESAPLIPTLEMSPSAAGAISELTDTAIINQNTAGASAGATAEADSDSSASNEISIELGGSDDSTGSSGDTTVDTWVQDNVWVVVLVSLVAAAIVIGGIVLCVVMNRSSSGGSQNIAYTQLPNPAGAPERSPLVVKQ